MGGWRQNQNILEKNQKSDMKKAKENGKILLKKIKTGKHKKDQVLWKQNLSKICKLLRNLIKDRKENHLQN